MREIKKFEWDISDTEKLFVHSISADMKIEKGLEKQIQMEVEISGFKKDIEDYKPHVKRDGENVEIDLFPHTPFFPDGFFAFGFIKFGMFEVQKVYLKIPDELSFGVETTSGNIVIDNINFKALKLSSVSGDLIIRPKTKTFFAKTTSGNIEFEGDSSRIGEMNVQSISGELKIKRISFDHAIIKTTSGDVTLTNVDPTFSDLDFKTISGDFSISFTSRPNVHVEVETISGNVKSNVNITGKLTRGAFDIGKPSSTLKFKSISGDANFEFGSDKGFEDQEQTDERLKIFEEILRSKRATKEEIKELMITLGYKNEEIEGFLGKES